MADIDVVRKRTSIWPWIIAIAIVAIALYFLFVPRHTGTNGVMGPASQLASPAVAPAHV